MHTERMDEPLQIGLVICSICYDVFHLNQLISLSQCGCTFCRSCLEQYVISVVRDRIDPTCACPTYACPSDGYLTDSEVQEVLSPDMYERYVVRKKEREVESNAALTYCPAAGCGAVCNVSEVPPATDDLAISGTTPYLSPRLMERVANWCRQRSTSGSMVCSRYRISTRFGTRVEERTSDRPIERPNQLGSKSTSPSKSRIYGQTACPAVRVVCHQCGFVFCARCHMGWQEEKPTLCNTSQPEKLARRHCNVSFVPSVMSKPHLSKGPLDRPNGCICSNPRDSANATVGSGSSNQDSFNSLIPHNDLNATPRSRSKKCKRPRVNPSWTSRVVLPPSTSQPSSSSHVDLSMLAVGFPPYPPNAWLKRCPACLVPIERVEGCAQMNCRACKHTFCWYCLSSLDDDFLLRHYDSGACKGKLGHSRASVIGHRIYAISVLAGLSVLLLIAAPFVIVSVPCFLCIKCQRVHLQRRLRKRHRGDLRQTNASETNDPTILSNDTPTPYWAGSTDLNECSSPLSPTKTPEKTVLAEKVDIHWSDISHKTTDEFKKAPDLDTSLTPLSEQSPLGAMKCTVHEAPGDILDPP